jgi:hypothetical protein
LWEKLAHLFIIVLATLVSLVTMLLIVPLAYLDMSNQLRVLKRVYPAPKIISLALKTPYVYCVLQIVLRPLFQIIVLRVSVTLDLKELMKTVICGHSPTQFIFAGHVVRGSSKT